MTLTFVPKVVVDRDRARLAGPWMLDQLMTYTTELYDLDPALVAP